VFYAVAIMMMFPAVCVVQVVAASGFRAARSAASVSVFPGQISYTMHFNSFTSLLHAVSWLAGAFFFWFFSFKEKNRMLI
jgi:hypothetical protein